MKKKTQITKKARLNKRVREIKEIILSVRKDPLAMKELKELNF